MSGVCSEEAQVCGKRESMDGLQPEHLKYGEHPIILCLQRVFDIIHPSCMPEGVTIPVLKDNGFDPLNPNNNHRTTPTSLCQTHIIFDATNLTPVLKNS